MPITDWPQAERPREKLLARGAEALSDAEILALLFGTGTNGQDAVALARLLLKHFEGLRPLLEAPPEALQLMPGMGSARYAMLQAALELGQRYTYASLDRGDALESPGAAEAYLLARMKAYEREVFACLYLDNRHRVIAFEELFFGTIDSATVHPREIARNCLKHNCAALILAHNHPSGIAEPSMADSAITRRIVDALKLIEVRVLDHLVIGDATATSMAARGLL